MNIKVNQNKVSDNTIGLLIVLIVSTFVSATISNYILLHFLLLLMAFYVSLKGGVASLYMFTIYTLLQNFFLVLFSPTLTPIDTKLFIFYKEFIVYLSICVFFIIKERRIKDGSTHFLLLFFALILVFNIIRPGASFNLKLVSLRQLLIPFVCFFWGYSIVVSSTNMMKYFKFFVMSMVLVGIIGLLMYPFEPVTLWNELNFPQYFFNKNGALYQSNYVNFYSWDFGIELKRFVSIMADPIAAAHLIGLVLVYLIIVDKKLIVLKCFFVICAFTCVSKSIIFLFCSMGLVMLYIRIKKGIYRLLFFISSFISIFVLFTFATIYVEGLEQNTASGNHLTSVIFAVNNNSLLGSGLGSAGYLAGVMTKGDIEAEYNESFMAVLIAQLGLLGTFVFYFYFFVKIVQFIRLYRRTYNNIVLFGLVLLTDVILESIVSGSSIAMLGTGLYFIISGMIYNHYLSLLKINTIKKEYKYLHDELHIN